MNWGKFLLFIVIGFAAQIIDGTLGMAYGVSCRTFLKTVAGLPSALASAVVHVAEVPTTLASGLSHIKLKNVDKSLFFHLAIPGVIGGVAGAWFLSSAGDALEPVHRRLSHYHGRCHSAQGVPEKSEGTPHREGHLPARSRRRLS